MIYNLYVLDLRDNREKFYVVKKINMSLQTSIKW